MNLLLLLVPVIVNVPSKVPGPPEVIPEMTTVEPTVKLVLLPTVIVATPEAQLAAVMGVEAPCDNGSALSEVALSAATVETAGPFVELT